MTNRVYYPEARVIVYATFAGTSLRGTGTGAFAALGVEEEPVIAFPALPMACEVQRNSYDQADSWSVDFDYRDFPVAPQSLEACAIEVYLYDRGSLRADLATLVGPGTQGDLSQARMEPAISGLCDSAMVEWGENGAIVTLEGQDYTALFLEKTWKTKDRITSSAEAKAAGLPKRSTKKSDVGHPEDIPSGRALDVILRELIAEVDVTGRIKLDVRTGGVTIPVVGKEVSRTVKSGFKTDRDASYWTVMSKLARLYGFILFVEGPRVVLSMPQVLRQGTDRIFRLRWGENLKTLRMERQLGKERVPQIEVRSYDDQTRTTLVARFPEKNQRATTGIGTRRDERRTYTIYGIRDMAVLLRYAENLYDLIGRGEQETEFSTDDLRDPGALDFLSLRTSDAILIEFDAIWEEVRNMDPAQIQAVLLERGYPANVASFLSQNYQKLDSLKAPQYLKEARLSWDVNDGVSIEGKLINFVTLDGASP